MRVELAISTVPRPDRDATTGLSRLSTMETVALVQVPPALRSASTVPAPDSGQATWTCPPEASTSVVKLLPTNARGRKPPDRSSDSNGCWLRIQATEVCPTGPGVVSMLGPQFSPMTAN